MRILLDHGGYSLRNLGDISMLQAAVTRLRHSYPQAEVHVFNADAINLVKYCPNVVSVPANLTIDGRALWCQKWGILGAGHKLFPSSLHNRLRLFEQSLRNMFPHLSHAWIKQRMLRRNQSAVKDMNQYFDLVQSADLVVAAGGGYVTDAFEVYAAWVLGNLSLAQALGKPTYMFGQGLGPLNSPWLRGLASKTLSGLNGLSLRESKSSVPLLESLGIDQSKVIVTGDDAIEIAYKARVENIGTHLGVNLRMATYSGIGNDTAEIVFNTLKIAAARHAVKMVPLPISFHEADSDIDALRKSDLFSESEIDAYASPEQIIEAISKCRVVVTGSYHAGVFALSQGIPVIGLSKSQYYDAKFSGLADQFVEGCWMVSLSEADVGEILLARIQEAWDRAEELRTSLLARANKQIASGLRAYQSMAVNTRT